MGITAVEQVRMAQERVAELRRPYLRKRFFVRRHRGWGAAVCWHQWSPVHKHWGTNWGIGCKTMREAKVIRKFLNSKVQRWHHGDGVPFATAVMFVTGRSEHGPNLFL